MSFLVRIEYAPTGKVWWEIRETEDDVDALIESVYSRRHMEHLVCYTELNDEGPDWLKKP